MKPFFLSLKWQAVISVSVILLLGFGLVTYFGQQNLQETYRSQRNRVHQDRQQTLYTALQTLQRQMINIANHMQGLAVRTAQSESPKSVSGQPLSALLAVLGQNWDQLSFEWGLGAITLYSSSGEVISTMGSSVIERLLPRQEVEDIGKAEQPLAQVRCDRSCWQIVAVPILLDDSEIGVLVLSKDMSDVVLEFQSATAADVGILVTRPKDLDSFDLRSIDAWQQDIVALTGMPTSYDILQQLAAKQPMSALSAQRALQSWNTYEYEISFLYLTEALITSGVTLIVLENVSADLLRLNSTLSDLFFTALVIFVLVEASLLYLLSGPMMKIGQISRTLPKLVGDERNTALSELQVEQVKPRIRNEIHQLYDSAALLSETLLQLDDEVKERTQKLQQKGDELLKEHVFVTTLLNNVQAIILTQNSEGQIIRLNSQGARLLGLRQNKPGLANFQDYVELTEHTSISSGLKKLFAGRTRKFQHESHLRVQGERQYFIDWRHSRLPESREHEPLVLSVGLDLTARKHAETNLAWLADHDPLTELPNRRRFHIEFNSILKKSRRNRQSGALVYCDIDQFKTINDVSGHPAGDRLLRIVAQRLTDCIREVDVLARLGGDEFAILLDETDSDGAIKLVNKLCERLSDLELMAGNTTHRITLSMGLALFPEHGSTADELMAYADLSMYKAKNNGRARNSWSIYAPEDRDKHWMQEQVDWKARIQNALKEERFILYYQPIFDIESNRFAHYEALLRMLDPDENLVPPNKFIPVAEKTGLIYDIDRYVIQRAIRDLRNFTREGRNIALSINLSVTANAKMDFVDTIEKLVEQYGVERSRLIFELTETSAVEDLIATAEVIQNCRKLGYMFSLDDFGSGYASWFYLRQLPVDFVKIDGSFVQNLASSEEDRLFVTAINDVAQGLGKKTVAEYVENEELLEILRSMGVNFAQGYFIGKPQPELLDDERIFVTPSTGASSNRVVPSIIT